MSTGTALRVGTDVVAVHEVAASVDTFGARYLERVYTEHELKSCVGSPTVQAARLAARSPPRKRRSRSCDRSAISPIGALWRSAATPRDGAPWP